MGGNLTMYVAGCDDRVKAAVPAVGGSGWRWQPHEFIGGTAQPDQVKGDVEVFRRTLSFESYAPNIRCPVLHRSGTNDFHGWMDDVYRTNALIQNQPTRYSWSTHLNHRLNPEVAIAMPLWFDHYLKGGPALPETPASTLTLAPEPMLRVTPDAKALPVARVEIYYSVDSDPRARFWRSAEVTRSGDSYTAKLPLHTAELPLYAFANVYHKLPKAESLAAIPGSPASITEVCISSLLYSRAATEIKQANPTLTAKQATLIDDFSHGLRDWYQLNGTNPTHAQSWTRKLTDPMYRGATGVKLKLTLVMPKTNSLTLVLNENEWRSYRGPRKTYTCKREFIGAESEQSLTLDLADFTPENEKDGSLKSWAEIDQLGICAHYTRKGEARKEPQLWNGPAVKFVRLEWV